MDLSDGLAAVVGVNANGSFADQVYLLVKHGEQPMTYEAVLSWRRGTARISMTARRPVLT